MGYYLKLAWRNIFRNRKRTFLTGLIIAIGLALIMFTDGMVVGMKKNMIDSATNSFMGDAQIHRNGFQDTYDAELTIEKKDQLVNKLNQDETVRAFSKRAMSYGTISSPAEMESIIIYGIEPESEKMLSKMDEAIQEGEYIGTEQGVMLGSKLAERLDVSLGDRIVLTVSEAKTGNLSQDMFRISGIYTMNIDEMDASMAFISLSNAQELFGIEKSIHEIAVAFHSFRYAMDHGKEFSSVYSVAENTAQPWPKLLPEMKNILDMTDYSIGIVVIIVFAVIVFGIMNTLFMALYERIFEFGVLRAVGTRPSGIRKMIVFEAGSLAVYSIIIGLILGTIINTLGAVIGFGLTGIELAGTTFTERIYVAFKLRQFILHPVLIFGFTLLVSLYPARYAGKMSITHALQKTL